MAQEKNSLGFWWIHEFLLQTTKHKMLSSVESSLGAF